MADSVAGILPGSIPRGAAKIGILSVGGLIAFSILQKVECKRMPQLISLSASGIIPVPVCQPESLCMDEVCSAPA